MITKVHFAFRFTADSSDVYKLALLIPEALKQMDYEEWHKILSNDRIYNRLQVGVTDQTSFEVSNTLQ